MKTLELKSIVCSAFPGTGKTYYCAGDYQPVDFAIDSDSSKFDKQDFPQNYIEHIKNSLGKHSRIFVSSHQEVRSALIQNEIEFTLVYPDVSLKNEYIERYKKRGSNNSFIKLINDNWDDWISQLQNQKGCKHIVLKSGQFISNVL